MKRFIIIAVASFGIHGCAIKERVDLRSGGEAPVEDIETNDLNSADAKPETKGSEVEIEDSFEKPKTPTPDPAELSFEELESAALALLSDRCESCHDQVTRDVSCQAFVLRAVSEGLKT